MSKLILAITVILAATVSVTPVAQGAGKRPGLSVSFEHGSKSGGVKVDVHNTSGVDYEKVTLSLSVVKTNGIAIESDVVITGLAADGRIPAKISLPLDGASVARVDVIKVVARTAAERRVMPDVQVVLAH